MLKFDSNQLQNLFWNSETNISKIPVNTDNLNESSINQNIEIYHSGSQNSETSGLRLCNSPPVVENNENLAGSPFMFLQNNLNSGDIVRAMSVSPQPPPAVWDHQTIFNQNEPQTLDPFPAVNMFSDQNLFVNQNNQFEPGMDFNTLMSQNAADFANIGMTNNSSSINSQFLSNQTIQNTFTNMNDIQIPDGVGNVVSMPAFSGQAYDGSCISIFNSDNSVLNNNIQLSQNGLLYPNNNIPIQNPRGNIIVQVYQNGQTFLASMDQTTYNSMVMNSQRSNMQFQVADAVQQLPTQSTIRATKGRQGSESSIVQKNFEPLDLMENPANWRRMPNNGGYMCNICTKRYTRKYGLKIHLRIHSGFKPLECKICRKKFGDPSNMAKHIRLHSTEGSPYKCNLCDKQLVRRRDLERHMRSRHPDISTKQPDNNKRKR